MEFLQFVLVLAVCVTLVNSGGDYVCPLNMGMQMAIPYDLANIFIRPIAGGISVALSISMLYVLIFSVITSPFGYMFGIPSRKYVLGGTEDEAHPAPAARSFDSDKAEDKWEEGEELNGTNFFENERVKNLKHFEIKNSLPFLLPSETDGQCNQLLICYSHGLFTKMPPTVLRFFQFFSRRLINGNEETKKAIKIGLGGVKACDSSYTGCPYGPFKLAVKTFRHMLPDWWRSNLADPNTNRGF